MQKQSKYIVLFIIMCTSPVISSDKNSSELLQILQTTGWELHKESKRLQPCLCIKKIIESVVEPSETIYPLYSSEQAHQIVTTNFVTLPTGVTTCLEEILSGKNSDDIFRLTPTHIIIKDKTNPHQTTTFRRSPLTE